MLKYPLHDAFSRFMHDLNHVYMCHSALWEKDFYKDGFEWVNCHMGNQCSYAFLRKSNSETMLCVFNFSGVEQELKLNLNCKSLKRVIASDRDIYGGETCYDKDTIRVYKNNLSITLPPFASHIYIVK